MNNNINVAQFGVSGYTDPGKRLIVGYDVNGAGFGYIKAGWYDHQWTNLALQPNGGNVGIGTSNPYEMLTIGYEEPLNANAKKTIRIAAGGFAEPGGNFAGSNGDKIILFDGAAAGYDGRIGVGTHGNFWMISMTPGGAYSNFEWYVGNSNAAPKMVLASDGALSLGTSNAHGFKLAVAGNAIAESMTVKPQANWPDYVFSKGYFLPSLRRVNTYIQAKKHLPRIPSAAEVAKDGLNLGEMNMKLLKKVEELSLYLI